MHYVASGTGGSSGAASDTMLFTRASEARVVVTPTRETTTTSNDAYQVVGTLTADANKTITNAGLFDVATGENIFMKRDFTGGALNAGDSIQLAIKVSFS